MKIKNATSHIFVSLGMTEIGVTALKDTTERSCHVLLVTSEAVCPILLNCSVTQIQLWF